VREGRVLIVVHAKMHFTIPPSSIGRVAFRRQQILVILLDLSVVRSPDWSVISGRIEESAGISSKTSHAYG